MKPWLLLLLVLFVRFNAMAQNVESFKSLLIYKFAEYIIWPDGNGKVKVGSVGSGDIFNQLSSFAAKKDLMSVVSIANEGEIGDCNLVFLSQGTEDQLKSFRSRIRSSSVLIVSENRDDIRNGADIVIFEEEGRIKFILNQKTIKAKGLDASRRLSKLSYSM